MIGDARSLVAVVAATVLGVAIRFGTQWVGVALLIPTIVLAGIAALSSSHSSRFEQPGLAETVYRLSFTVGVILFTGSLLDPLNLRVAGDLVLLVFGLVAIAGAGYAVVVLRRGAVAFSAFIGAFLIVTIGVLAITPDISEEIDVALFQEDSSAALLDGHNPYAMTFADIYLDTDEPRYGPGVSEGGVLQFGYPYLPLSLLVVAPFELILGDFRFAHALAIIGAAVVISRIRPGKDSQTIAVLFLLLSPVFHILIFGWIEPLLILGASLVVFAASRRHVATPYLAGALIALKQYGVLLTPASLLLLPRPWTARAVTMHLLKMGGVVAATVLPFFLWNPAEFTWSVVELQFVQPFRPDSMSFMAAWAAIAGEPGKAITTLLPILVIGLATLAVWKWSPTGGQGFALASALTLLVAFAFSKQAFANYYILVLGLLFVGAAARNPDDVQQSAEIDARTDTGGQASLPAAGR